MTEKQVSTMNKFLEFFGEKCIVQSENETWDQARSRAIAEKNRCFERRTDGINQKVEQLFKS